MYSRRSYLDMIILLVIVTVLVRELPYCEGNPYPFMNVVSRVSRGPSIRSNEDELDGSSQLSQSSSSRLAFLKSPAFHMRFRPNRYAHLHVPSNFPRLPLDSSSSSSSSSGGSPLFRMNGGPGLMSPSEEIRDSSEFLLNDEGKNYGLDTTGPEGGSSPSFVGGSGLGGNPGSGTDGNDNDSSKGDGSNMNTEEPTFTPFISARALSNMGKFFEHLRENLVAIQQDGLDSGVGADGDEIGPPERRRIVHAGAGDDYPQAQSDQTDGRNTNDEPSEVTNPDYTFTSSPDGKGPSALAMALRWQPPASGQFRGAIPSPLSSNGSGSRLHKMQTFVQPMTEEEAYLRKANNYNPSWLWTNMGLGRKRRR